MNISQDVATIQGHPEVEFDVLIQPVLSERKGGVPVLETTLSIPSPGILDVFCADLTYGYGVTFILKNGVQMDLYYTGKNGNYQQFFSHP
ncbi:TPA: hypothetical protein RY268_000039 [Citrobacter freundii]|nr:hypothetical protein [Citrobacter freundii]HEB0904761.1 hypothetical protein [Citrobacter freundii]